MFHGQSNKQRSALFLDLFNGGGVFGGCASRGETSGARPLTSGCTLQTKINRTSPTARLKIAEDCWRVLDRQAAQILRNESC